VADVYELCRYLPHDGKLDALLARFREHTVRLFARHGIRSVGYWLEPRENDRTRLVYLLQHPDRESAAANWASFGQDPEWLRAYQASMSEGPLVEVIEKWFLDPADFSPLR
jgi:hypothetical protein